LHSHENQVVKLAQAPSFDNLLPVFELWVSVQANESHVPLLVEIL